MQWVIWYEEFVVTPMDRFILCKIWNLPIWGLISQRAIKNLPLLGLSHPPLRDLQVHAKFVGHNEYVAATIVVVLNNVCLPEFKMPSYFQVPELFDV